MTKIICCVDGELINTDFYEFQVQKSGIMDAWQITATYAAEPGLSFPIYRGSIQECRAYLNRLARLCGAFAYRDEGFHLVESEGING